MECKNKGRDDYYSITWSIRNFSYCWQKNKKAIASPTFSVNIPEETKWKLMLFPRGSQDGNYIAVFLYRDKECNFPGNIEVKYSFEILGRDGSVWLTSEATNKFGKDQRMGFPKYLARKTVITTEKLNYLPQDTLTLCCKMEKFEENTIQIEKIFAQTIINVQRISFVWRIEKFSQLTSKDIRSFVIKSSSGCRVMQINIALINEQGLEEKIGLIICSFERYLKFAAIKTYILDLKNRKIESGEYECLFEVGKWLKKPLKFTNNMLMEKKNLYLLDDVLSINFEVAISTGILLEGVENVEFGTTFHQPTNEVAVNLGNFSQEEKIFDEFSELKADLMSLYTDQNLSDMKLKTKTNNFPVHTSILGARSPVFRAMFSSDMKEKVNGCVDVSDLEDETVRRFLLYLYSDQLEDLNWDIALQLFKVADKYAVISLRNECSTFLKNNLNLKNACEGLLLSELHQDKELKEIAQTFILKNAKGIFKSEEWKLFFEANSKLAMETMLRNWIED